MPSYSVSTINRAKMNFRNKIFIDHFQWHNFHLGRLSFYHYQSELAGSSHSDFGEIGINLQEVFDFVFENGYCERGACEKSKILVLLDSLLSKSSDGWVEPVFKRNESSCDGIGR
jgi:hypothetical protein